MPITGSPYEKDWRDYFAGGTSVSAAALEDSELRVSQYTDAALATQSATLMAAIDAVAAGRLTTIEAYGAVGSNPTLDTEAVLEAIATGETVVIPPTGDFHLNDELVLAPGQTILGLGGTLSWPVDLGAGQYAIRWTGTGWGSNLVNVHVRGPGWFGGLNPDQDPGVSPALMRGVWIPAGGRAQDVRVNGFETGIEFRENNEWLINVYTGGNLVGIRAADGATGGDQVFVNVRGDRDYLATVHIDVGATIAGARFSTFFSGNTPYGFYAPAGGAAQAILGCDFIDAGFEGYGNGIIYAAGNRSCYGLTFTRCGEGSGLLGPDIPGNPKEAPIDAFGLSFVSDNGFPTAVGSNGIMQGRSTTTCQWNDFENCLAAATAAGKPALATPNPANGCFASTSASPQIEFCRPTQGGVTAGSITANDLVQTWSDGVKKADNGIPRGVALATNYAGGCVPIAQAGIVPIKTADTGFNGVHAYVKQTAGTPGNVVVASSAIDGDVIGHNVGNIASGLVPVKLRGLA